MGIVRMASGGTAERKEEAIEDERAHVEGLHFLQFSDGPEARRDDHRANLWLKYPGISRIKDNLQEVRVVHLIFWSVGSTLSTMTATYADSYERRTEPMVDRSRDFAERPLPPAVRDLIDCVQCALEALA